jgi:acetolactate synthase regulatory subunit
MHEHLTSTQKTQPASSAIGVKAITMPGKAIDMVANNFVQRKRLYYEDKNAQPKPLTSFIQKKEMSGGTDVIPDSVSNRITSTRGTGNPLDIPTKSFMESRFGADFSKVHIHAGKEASQLSEALNAQAFTVGNDIYFNSGKYTPESLAGKRLLAHELTHTLQQKTHHTSVQRIITEHTDRQYSTHAEALPRSGPAPIHLGDSAGNRSIDAFQFTGTTSNHALVLGGVHGSELSGIEVVETLLNQLRTGPRPYYTVTIVPRLFPDNAAIRESDPAAIRADTNVGRYTGARGVDPNRQMPEFGRSFDPATSLDSRARPIERENIMLLNLINSIRPSRIVSVHAMHSDSAAGIFADPRTDQNQIALGYTSDKALALEMARLAQSRGATVSGNRLGTSPENTTYALDPAIAQPGQRQRRSRGEPTADHRGEGVSLGGWGSTAVCDASNPSRNRQAMRIITIEMPRGQRIQDMQTQAQQDARRVVVQAHVDAIREIFLGPNQVEQNTPPACP